MTTRGGPTRTGSRERRLATRTKTRKKAAKAAPLKALPVTIAAPMTDTNGDTSRYPATRADGRQPARTANSHTPSATCHAIAAVRQPLAIEARPIKMSSVEGIVVTGKAHPRQISERCSDDGDACRWFFRAGGTCNVLHGQHGTRCAPVMSPPGASLRSTGVTASPVPGAPLPQRKVGGSVFNHVHDCCGLFRIGARNLWPGRQARR